jgi:hypothetical protein
MKTGDQCKCQYCGKPFKVDINIPDDLWEQIKPIGKPVGAGLLCGHCIMHCIESMDEYDSFDLRRTP